MRAVTAATRALITAATAAGAKKTAPLTKAIATSHNLGSDPPAAADCRILIGCRSLAAPARLLVLVQGSGRR